MEFRSFLVLSFEWIAWCAVLGGLMVVNRSAAKADDPRSIHPAGNCLVARWCFETGDEPTEDTATGGEWEDTLEVTGNVTFEDGLAKFAAFDPHGALRARPSRDLSFAEECTVWLRLMVCRNPRPEDVNNSVPVPLLTADHWRMSLVSYGKKIYHWSVTGKISQDGSFEDIRTVPPHKASQKTGQWLQAAMVIGHDPAGQIVARWFYRSEGDSKSNPWVYVGRSMPVDSLPQGEGSLTIGSREGARPFPAEVWIDEVRIYSKALTAEELNDCWPVLAGYRWMPNRPPGVVIDHSPARSKRYLPSSPAVVIMPDGSYVAKGTLYGPAQGDTVLCRLYRSTDRGRSWSGLSEVEGITWSSLFVHRGDLYMMGTSGGHGKGYCVISRSRDGGRTWTEPSDENTGRLFSNLSYHTAPVPVVVHDGRIWRPMEDEQGSVQQWGEMFRAFMMSAPVDADLLKASSWTSSDRLEYNPRWLDGKFRGWLEGNAVVAPDGRVVDFLRVSVAPEGGKAAMIVYSGDGKTSSFDPASGFVDFPGGSKKFFIKHDAQSGMYWALSNIVLPKHSGDNCSPSMVRNALALMSSGDLRQWEVRNLVLYHPDVVHHAFQYPTFQFDGDDLIFVCRTAYDDGLGGASRQHDSNFFTFHRIRHFREIHRGEDLSLGSILDEVQWDASHSQSETGGRTR